jgi:quinol monooxygenase YgiN
MRSSPSVNDVLTRIWRTGFDTTRRVELEAFAETISAPMFRRLPGCLGYIYAISEGTWITQTFWESEDHIRRAEDSAVYQEVVAKIVAAGFLGDTQTTEIFEVTGYQPPGA